MLPKSLGKASLRLRRNLNVWILKLAENCIVILTFVTLAAKQKSLNLHLIKLVLTKYKISSNDAF